MKYRGYMIVLARYLVCGKRTLLLRNVLGGYRVNAKRTLLLRIVLGGYRVYGKRILLVGMYYVDIVCVGNVHYW